MSEPGQYYVDIVAHDGDEVVKTLGPYASERMANRANDGVNRNLNHEAFYTTVRA